MVLPKKDIRTLRVVSIIFCLLSVTVILLVSKIVGAFMLGLSLLSLFIPYKSEESLDEEHVDDYDEDDEDFEDDDGVQPKEDADEVIKLFENKYLNREIEKVSSMFYMAMHDSSRTETRKTIIEIIEKNRASKKFTNDDVFKIYSFLAHKDIKRTVDTELRILEQGRLIQESTEIEEEYEDDDEYYNEYYEFHKETPVPSMWGFNGEGAFICGDKISSDREISKDHNLTKLHIICGDIVNFNSFPEINKLLVGHFDLVDGMVYEASQRYDSGVCTVLHILEGTIKEMIKEEYSTDKLVDDINQNREEIIREIKEKDAILRRGLHGPDGPPISDKWQR